MKRQVTYEEVKAAVDALPADGTNPGCYYTMSADDGPKHCAVGQVLVDLGLPCPTPSDEINETSFGIQSVKRWFDERGVSFDEPAQRLLNQLQERLDTHSANTWGDARRQVCVR